MGTARPTPTITTLPHEILAQILGRVTPVDIAAYSQSCRSAHQSASDRLIWSSASCRHLAVAPFSSSPSSANSVYSLAKSLVCTWRLVPGGLIPDVTSHCRSGFNDIRARGGVQLPITDDSPHSCYVFGTDDDRVVPSSLPALCMDFSLKASGPFPNDGMTIRIVHGADRRLNLPPPSPPPTLIGLPITTDTALAANMADLNLGPAHFPASNSSTKSEPCTPTARITVHINDVVVLQRAVPATTDFSVQYVEVPADLLHTNPRINTLVVEYDSNSTASYWLKDILLTPSILPVPPYPMDGLTFAQPELVQDVAEETQPKPVREPSQLRRPNSAMHPADRHRNHVKDARHKTNTQSAAQAAARRAAAARLLESPPQKNKEETPLLRHMRPAKHTKYGKKQKYMYHQNYYRSPRGDGPSSPSVGRTGR